MAQYVVSAHPFRNSDWPFKFRPNSPLSNLRNKKKESLHLLRLPFIIAAVAPGHRSAAGLKKIEKKA